MKTRIALLFVSTMTLAACGGSPSPSNPTPADPAASPSTPSSPSGGGSTQNPGGGTQGNPGTNQPGPQPDPQPQPGQQPAQPAPQPQPQQGNAAPASLSHHRCGWIFTIDSAAAQTFIQNAAYYDAIHPDWFALQSDSVGIRNLKDVDNAAVLAAAKANHVAVIPLVTSVESVDWTRAMISDPGKRAAHVAELVKLAQSHNYDGLDLDYEHLWNPSDKAPLLAFIQQFAAAMHAVNKSASMAVPALDGPSSVWDYAATSAALDDVHMMGYDFHTIGTHAGPTAPLGWIEQVNANVQAQGGHPEKFILGLPNYGVTTTSACTLSTCAATCTGPVSTTTTEMDGCASNTNHYRAGRILNCNTAAGMLFFDDTQSLEEKVSSAKGHGIGGIGYWNVGGEPTGYFAMVKKYF